jgi:hypothetical protein
VTYRVVVYGGGQYDDSDKEMAYLDAKRWSAGEYAGTEVHLFHDKRLVRIYYDGRLTENMEE